MRQVGEDVIIGSMDTCIESTSTHLEEGEGEERGRGERERREGEEREGRGKEGGWEREGGKEGGKG